MSPRELLSELLLIAASAFTISATVTAILIWLFLLFQ